MTNLFSSRPPQLITSITIHSIARAYILIYTSAVKHTYTLFFNSPRTSQETPRKFSSSLPRPDRSAMSSLKRAHSETNGSDHPVLKKQRSKSEATAASINEMYVKPRSPADRAPTSSLKDQSSYDLLTLHPYLQGTESSISRTLACHLTNH